jgi:hypothetical protein
MKNSEQSSVEQQRQPPLEPNKKQTSALLGEAGVNTADTENIYLDLDAILDTRLGTLSVMGDEHPIKVLASGKYHSRMSDEFEGVSVQAFREAYAKRDIDTLKRSVLTNVTFFLRRLVKDSLVSAVMNQRVEKMCFTVNVYPYDFDDPSLVEMLIACIRFHTYSTSNVQVVSIPDEELTPEFVSKNYQIMIRYNWVDWVSKHKQFFEQRGIPSVTVVVPEIFYDVVPSQEDIDRLGMRKQNPFRMTESITAALFRLKHLPASLFSIHEGIRKDNAADIATRMAVTERDIEDYLNKNYPEATLVQDNPLPVVDLSPAYDLL